MAYFTINLFDYKSWEKYRLKDYAEFSDMTSDILVRTHGDDTTSGTWYFIDDELHLVPDQGSFKVIYVGTWGNDHSPGASSYTYAFLYDVDCPDDMAAYAEHVGQLQSAEEYMEDEEDEEEGEDEEDEEEEELEEDGEDWTDIPQYELGGEG